MTPRQFKGRCGHCGSWHTGPCPLIKSIEYWPDGTIKKIEYLEWIAAQGSGSQGKVED